MDNYSLVSRIFGLAFLILGLWACNDVEDQFNVLIFSKTEAFRHESIEAGIVAIKKMGNEHHFAVEATEDADVFTQKELQKYQVIIFLSTTGNILNEAQQQEFQRWIQAGGGFVGIHAATDTEYDWPWYNALVGAYFSNHPPGIIEASIDVVDPTHISTSHLPKRWTRKDEWYNFQKLIPETNKLLNLDESSYEGGNMGKEHPVAWYREYDGGRTWYTALGHAAESFSETNFLKHLWGGILYAAGPDLQVDYKRLSVAPEENRFEKVVLASNLNEPMELDFLSDWKIILVERHGDVKIYDPATRVLDKAFHINVNDSFEDGLLGLAVDPDFDKNQWVYFFYSHPIESHQVVARYTYYPDSIYTFADEKVIITIPTQRKECCHAAGSIQFGKDKLLYIATGDNTNPFESDGFSPSDDRQGRAPFDARRTSANTNDLRGKVLRIKINDDGTYSIPEGNLFPEGSSLGRPEIYVMGCRNPFRISVDQKKGTLFWGDVGPDSPKAKADRGPEGHDEINKTDQPGFFGWPLFVGDNKAYYQYDFNREISGRPFDPEKPLNQSANNTGAEALPPAQPAFIWYPYKGSDVFPLMGNGGRTAMAGPVFYSDQYIDHPDKFPAYFDGKFFIYEWMRGWIMAVTFDDAGRFKSMERFLPSLEFSNPVDMEFTVNGELYLLEYGKIWNAQNEDARLVHVKYTSGNRRPIAKIEVSEKYGMAPLTVSLSADSTLDYDNDRLTYEWYIDGKRLANTVKMGHTFTENGIHSVKLKVTDSKGMTGSTREQIWVGNSRPELQIAFDANKTFYWDKQETDYQVSVRDQEDGQLGDGIPAESVTISMDYLDQGYDINKITIGHQQAAIQSLGERLIIESTCLSCHQKNKASVGPAYMQVAERYAEEDPMDVLRLANKIIKGGSGVWGQHVMSAHPDLKLSDAQQMVDYILSLNDAENKAILPISGTFVFNQHLDQEFGGLYIIKGSYTDKGGNGIEPITAHEQIVLRHNKVKATDYDMHTHSRTVLLEKELIPELAANYEIVELYADNYIGYKKLDLTGIKYVRIHSYQPKEGSIELRRGNPTGTIIGQGNFDKTSENESPWTNMVIPLTESEGIHDLLLYFRNADGQAGSVKLFYFEFLETIENPISSLTMTAD
ncbi:MAG: hypothetical protein DHS20C18_44560 [Saprospiraceae bacterium]|nr:MAG: hypothetical protein DHS20C18_44560 [Saprospiraceae bacterium]